MAQSARGCQRFDTHRTKMSKLEFNHYGKHMVRLLRMNKSGPAHEVCEWEADAILEGDLAGSRLSDDNPRVVPADTVKNTVPALAHALADATRDGFAQARASHFTERPAHFSAAEIEVREKLWTRMASAGKPHLHSFVCDANVQAFSFLRAERGKPAQRAAAIRGFVIRKTTESGFVGYPKCDLTKLGRPAGQKNVFLPTGDPLGFIEAVVAR